MYLADLHNVGIRCILLFICLCQSSFAAESQIELAHPHIDFHNDNNIAKGANHFAQRCLSCHSMHGLANDPVSIKAGITKETQPNWDSTSWGGHPPPDLSLIAKRQSTEWIYTYLNSYYIDQSRPTGYNNLVIENTSMPNLFAALQGKQILVKYPNKNLKWFEVLELDSRGSMTPAEFNNMIMDIVNYLNYAAEPSKEERESVGIWVLSYLFVLWLVLMALNHLYWQPIKNKKKEHSD